MLFCIETTRRPSRRSAGAWPFVAHPGPFWSIADNQQEIPLARCHTTGTRYANRQCSFRGWCGLRAAQEIQLVTIVPETGNRRPEFPPLAGPKAGLNVLFVTTGKVSLASALPRLLLLPSLRLGPTWATAATWRSPLRFQCLQPVWVGHSCILSSVPCATEATAGSPFLAMCWFEFLGYLSRFPPAGRFFSCHVVGESEDAGPRASRKGSLVVFTKGERSVQSLSLVPIRVRSAARLHRIRRGQ